MNINGYYFEGPYSIDAAFSQVGAVYVISDVNNKAIDVGQTDNLKDRIPNHERKSCWARNATGGIYVYALVQNEEKARVVIEGVIRRNNKFSCGIF